MAGIFWAVVFLSALGLVRASIIDVQVDEKKEYNHIADSVDLLSYVLLICVTILTVWIFKSRRLRFLHESGLAVIYGLLVGLVLKLSGSSRNITHMNVVPADPVEIQTSVPNISAEGSYGGPLPDTLLLSLKIPAIEYEELTVGASHKAQSEAERPPKKLYTYTFEGSFSGDDSTIEEKATFNPEIFFYVLLPPIIFYEGYSMRKKAFFENLGAILAFALIGTVISTFVIAFIVYGFAQFITSTVAFKFIDMVYFGAIISATDPVTVLSIFSDLHADVGLSGIILGESLLNDAVAIVLCSTIEEYSRISLRKGDDIEPQVLLIAILQFFTIFIGSVALGALVGSVTALMTKFTKIRDLPLLETSLFSLMSYSSYLLAEICGMSGIVAVLFCGIFQVT